MDEQKKVKLSECLWIDLTTFEQKRDFLLLGRGVETGIIAPSMQNVLAHDYNVIVELRKANAELEEERNIRDLEQRANGIMDVRKANVRKKRTLGSMWAGGHIIHNMQLAEEELRRQVKSLKAGN